MKTLLLTLLVSCASFGVVSGQITADFTIQSNVVSAQHIVEGDEPVYCFATMTTGNRHAEFYDAQNAMLFSVDFNAFPLMQGLENPSYYYSIGFVQRQLFDNDQEFEFVFQSYSGNEAVMIVVNEDGSILQQFDDGLLASMSTATAPSIYNTIDGTKMLVTTFANGGNQPTSSAVYSLPGLRWVSCCTDLSMFNLAVSEPETKQQTTPFPNPTGADVTIPYALPAGAQIGMLELLDLGGQQVRSWQVGPAFSSIRADLSGLPSGTYLTRLTAEGLLLESQKILLVK